MARLSVSMVCVGSRRPTTKLMKMCIIFIIEGPTSNAREEREGEGR